MKKIYSELARIQHELNAPKNLFNKFGNYYYRNAEGILAAVKPLLNGLALIVNDEPMMIGERYYIKATATLTDGEESVSATAYAREDEVKKGMDGCQLTGACSSYARKYALNALLMIDDSKDSDDDALSPKNPENAKEDKPKQQQKPAAQPKPQQKPQAVKRDAPADVMVADKLPEKAPEKPKNPVKEYIANELVFMGQMFEIPDKNEMIRKFGEMRQSLIDAKLIDDVDSDHQTMEQAKAMIDAIYKNFTPSGQVKVG